MDIRHATAEDYNAIDVLLKEMRADRAVDRDVLATMLESESCAVLVVATAGEVVGMGVCNIVSKLDRQECRMDEIIVLHEYRGKGLGKSLFTACEDWAWSHSLVDRIEFTSRPSRTEAHEFYKNLGYDVRDTVVFCKKRGTA